jgi:S-adenosyl-L-methionine hydrolase (adenosine-forming)
MPNTSPIISILTDFGQRDGYVGTMKGVILNIVPNVQLIDISHEIQPQNIQQAASILADIYSYFPPHTVHLVVVDPGVGSTRQPIAVETPHGRFVAPDNGVLTGVLRSEPSWKAVLLNNHEYWLPNQSNTFHGRDIFSPSAAHLASGISLDKFGIPLDKLTMLKLAALVISQHTIKGEVTRIDHFGNVLTNIKVLKWIDANTLELTPEYDNKGQMRINAENAQVTAGWHTLEGIHRTYSEVPIGNKVALVGSGGELEISINQGNAAESTAIKVGDPVTIQLSS